jgi:hypothetical protein
MSTGGKVPSSRRFALENLTVQRASRSFCLSWTLLLTSPNQFGCDSLQVLMAEGDPNE